MSKRTLVGVGGGTVRLWMWWHFMWDACAKAQVVSTVVAGTPDFILQENERTHGNH